MNFAYGWAFARPVRKVYYNIVITGLSIGAAFIIGTIEILGILTTEFHFEGSFWNLMANFNINVAGFCIAAMFVLVWAAALIYWRVGKVEDKWTANVPPVPIVPTNLGSAVNRLPGPRSGVKLQVGGVRGAQNRRSA